MDNKDLYSPEEVARMCKAYRSVKGGFDDPKLTSDKIEKYEQVVPDNVRMILSNLDYLEFRVQNIK